MHATNPYAPPAEALPPAVERPSLPDGVRRYTLDPHATHEYIARLRRAAFVRLILVTLACFAFLATRGPIGRDAIIVLWPPMLVYLAIAWLVLRLRVRRTERKIVAGYELLVGPRAMRRTAFGVPPAEILAPEVTSIVEIPEGLSIVSSEANSRLFVLRALDGYSEVRDLAARWSPIVVRSGLGAWLRKRSHRDRERTRDRVFGTSLANDMDLLDELRELRAVATEPDRASIRAVRWRRRLVRIAWAFVAFMVGLWFFLTPPPKPGTPSAAPATTTVN